MSILHPLKHISFSSLTGRGRGVGLLLCLLLSLPIFAAQTAENDTLLNVLREELAADFTELQKQDVKPYFMSFRVQESWNARIAATFGYLGTSTQVHTRTFTPQIRVGSPGLDNFKFNNQSNEGAKDLPLTDASPTALRSAIWLHMLSAYDRVCNAYRSAQNRLRSQADNEDKAPCFSLTPNPSPKGEGRPSVGRSNFSPLSHERGGGGEATFYAPPIPHPFLTPAEQTEWEERLCRISAVFRQWSQFNEAVVNLQMENQRTHLVNTEGTAIVQNRVSYRVFIQAEMKTEDGMVLPLTQSYYATSLDSLPDEATMRRDAEDIGRRLVALAKAPVADPFTGPALMSGPASGVFFHEIFGHRLEGHRMKSGGQTFRKMVGQQVLPQDFQVYCDPTLTHYGQQPLNGGFLYDDEGTRARRVNNVVDGILKEFLMSRVPLDSFPESNGHGRTAEGRDPVSRQSNLVVETKQPHTEAQLRQMLRNEARRQGKEYGYLFQSVSGGYTQTGEGNSINSFNVNPLEVYRIYVDGRPDELVRGVDLIGTPLSMFSNIAAGGDTPSTFIGVCGAESGWVPVSATSPMVYVSKIETQRRQQKASLMPVLKAPCLTLNGLTPDPSPVGEGSKVTSANTWSPLCHGRGVGGEAIFSALSAELQRSMDSLRIEGQPAPFLIDYRLLRTRNFFITASDGELVRYDLQPWSQSFAAEVILGDYHRSSLQQPEPNVRGTSIPLALDYDNLRRAAWFATDASYKQAIATYEAKKQQRKKVTLPADEEALDDFLPAKGLTPNGLPPGPSPKGEGRQGVGRGNFTPLSHGRGGEANLLTERRGAGGEAVGAEAVEASLTTYVRRLSLIAREFPELTYTTASLTMRQADNYRLTSEGVCVAHSQPDDITIDFTFHLYHRPTGGNTSSTSNHQYSSVAAALADSTRFMQHVRDYIRRRLMVLGDSVAEDYYVGPVLIETNASKLIYNQASGPRHNFRAWHPFLQSDRAIFVKRGRKIIDEKLSIRQDPTLSNWQGKPLVGYFKVDANGQAPQAVTLVEGGIFRNQLCGATPALGTSKPTGNLRFNNPYVWNGPLGISTAPGVLRIESSRTMPLHKMRKQLLRDAQREGYDHAYITRAGFLYRVSVKDGTEKLIGFTPLTPSDHHLRHISALSTEQEAVTHTEDGGARFSIVGPQAILLNDIEVPAQTPPQIAKPVLTYPLLR